MSIQLDTNIMTRLYQPTDPAHGASNPKVFLAGEILRRLDEPLTETPTTR